MKIGFAYFLALIYFSVNLACVKKPESGVKAFVSSEGIYEDHAWQVFMDPNNPQKPFQLAFAASVGIKHTVKKRSQPYDEPFYNLSVTFEALSNKQYDQLVSHFKSVNPPKYNGPTQKYRLLSFLSPYIQAVYNKAFLLGASKEYAQANCWGAAYEYTRQRTDKVSVYFVKGREMFKVLRDNKYSEEIGSYPHNAKAPELPLQPGDMLLITGDHPDGGESYLHAAIYIDNDFYFQKPDASEESIYGFVHPSDWKDTYGKDNAIHTIRRFNGPEKLSLPDPGTGFTRSKIEEMFEATGLVGDIETYDITLQRLQDPLLKIETQLYQVAEDSKKTHAMQSVVDSYSPLHKAVLSDNLNTVKQLLTDGVDIIAKTADGDTPLHFAASFDLIEIAKELIKNGALLNIQDAMGDTPLHNAVKSRAMAVLSLLVELGADTTITDSNGGTLLMAAIESGADGAVKLLLSRDVKLADHEIERLNDDSFRKWISPEIQIILKHNGLW